MDGSRMLNLNRRDIHHLGAPISNFAVPEFDNPTVLENNVEIRAIPRPTGDETMRVFELLVRAAAADCVGTAKNSDNLLPRHTRFEAGHLLAGCAGGEKRDNREG
jgi:hypothetical protein